MRAAPWTDRTLVNAAFDIACDVRSLTPEAVVNPAMLAKVPAERLADLIVVMAYMIDIDRPFGVVTRQLGTVDETPRMRPYCPVGHPSEEHGYWGTGRSQRCRQCDQEVAKRAAA